MIIVYSGIVGSGKTLRAVCDSLSYFRNNSMVFANQYIKGAYMLPYNWYDFRYEERKFTYN